jgi:hypothetical protein
LAGKLHQCACITSFLIIFNISSLCFYLFIYCFTPRFTFFSLMWRRHHYRWRAAIFRPMLGAQGLWAGRDLYHTIPAVTRGLGFPCLIRRTASFCRLLQHARGAKDLFYPDPQGSSWTVKSWKKSQTTPMKWQQICQSIELCMSEITIRFNIILTVQILSIISRKYLNIKLLGFDLRVKMFNFYHSTNFDASAEHFNKP